MSPAKFVAVILLTICATANGEWKFVVENESKDLRYFLDTSRIDYDDSKIWIWFLMDYTRPQKIDAGTYYSMESLEAISCVNRESSFYDYIYYAEPGGRGKVIESDSFGGAGPVIALPDSIAETLVITACEVFVKTYKPKSIRLTGTLSKQ